MTKQRATPSDAPGVRPPTAIWLGALALPTLPLYFGIASSLALGTMIFVASIFVFSIRRAQGKFRKSWVIFLVVTLIATTLHLAVAALFFKVDLSRAAISLVLLAAGLHAAHILARHWQRWTTASINRSIDVVLIFAAVALVCSVSGLEPAGVRIFPKSVFPFTEPSHFALAFLPFLMYRCISAKREYRIILLCSSWAAAFLLQNLTLVVGSMLISFICLRGKSLFLLAVVALTVIASDVDLSYYASRIDFASNNTNLSMLVYLQGWQVMKASLLQSGGWGLGFQQLGVFGINVPAATRIMEVARENLNVLDGGFTMAKLVSEFGVIGIMLMAAYFLRAYRAARVLMSPSHVDGPIALAHSFILSYSIELLVRGAGYFTTSSVLFIAALLYLRRPKATDVGTKTRPQSTTKAIFVKQPVERSITAPRHGIE